MTKQETVREQIADILDEVYMRGLEKSADDFNYSETVTQILNIFTEQLDKLTVIGDEEIIKIWEQFDSEKPIPLADMIRYETFAQLQHTISQLKELLR